MAADDPQQAGPVLGVGDDVDVVLAQQRHHPLAQERLVLRDHYSQGSSARIMVPWPGGLWTASVPSIASTRWRRPGETAAVGIGAARPVVADRDHQAAARAREPHERRRAGVLGGVGERLGDHEVGHGLHDRRQALAHVGVDGHRDRRPPAERLDRGGQTAVGQHRRRDPAREVAQLGDRRARVGARLAQQRHDLRAVGEPVLGAAEPHAERDQARLRPVVQVALDPPQLRRLHVERAAARAGELDDAVGERPLAASRPGAQDHRVHGDRGGQAERRDQRPEVAAAAHRPHGDERRAQHPRDGAVDGQAAHAAGRDAAREVDGAVQGERHADPEPHPHRPEVAEADRRPHDRGDEAGERRQRHLQRQHHAPLGRLGRHVVGVLSGHRGTSRARPSSSRSRHHPQGDHRLRAAGGGTRGAADAPAEKAFADMATPWPGSGAISLAGAPERPGVRPRTGTEVHLTM